MRVLFSTHSPCFLETIEVYAAKHEITDKCIYYLAEKYGDTASLSEVTGDTEKTYKLLAIPFPSLVNER